MKKLIALFLLVLFTVACSDVNEDVIPDPVTPSVEIENEQSKKKDKDKDAFVSGEGVKKSKKPRN